MRPVHYISSEYLTLETLREIQRSRATLALSKEAIQRIERSRTYLDNKVKDTDAAFYGINTGFGSLCNVRISNAQIEQLQTNLVMSHACGMGDEVPHEVVKWILLLKVQSLSYGYSGVQLVTVQRLIDFYNHDILPVVYQLGSLGASGDLAPLAHLCLPLLGLGEVYYEGKKISGADLLAQKGWDAIRLQSKEGLALLNGTQFSLAYSVECILETERLVAWADKCAALSLDGFMGRLNPFDERLHRIRPHAGQLHTAAAIRALLVDSEIAALPKVQVQDPYSFRCVPQVHGATKDAITYIKNSFTIEVNSVTDNPNVFVEDDDIISGGNFHAQPLALPLDLLAIALAELGNISERRTYLLIAGQRDLPPFLAKEAGLNSGLMIPQYTAASIVSQNKQLCTPASVDSIVSSNGQEDHVSMAANAATKCYRVVKNVARILAIEWFNAAQAIAFRRPLKTSSVLEDLLVAYQKRVPNVTDDRVFSIDLHNTVLFFNETPQE